MQNPVATFGLPLSTGPNVQDPTTYKGKIDGAFAVLNRLGDAFAPHANSTPDMRVYLDPGHVFTGTTLTEVGADTLGTVTNASTSVAITGSTAGISGTMLVSGPGILANTTATIAGSTVTLSQAASGLAVSPQTSAPLRFMQRTAAIVAPGSNSRIDRIVIDRITAAVSVITGTPGVTPAVPALTAGVVPIAQVLLTSASTSITNGMITDERDLSALGGQASPQITIASATTTDIGSTKSTNVLISGTTTITALGSSATTDSPLYTITFSGSLTLTHNGASLKLPAAANIKTQANDSATGLYLGSGNWQILDYQRANGQSVSTFATETTLASASTTDLGSSNGNLINVTGTTTITAFGSTAVTANPIYVTRFTGALTLTHNASSLIMPGAANYTTAAGDTFYWKYEGSGNWRCVGYCLASGKALVTSAAGRFLRSTYFSSSTTWSPGAGCNAIEVELWGAGGGQTGVGGTSTFDVLSCVGGQPCGGTAAGGAASGGDVNLPGGAGGSTNASGLGGNGGNSPRGGQGGQGGNNKPGDAPGGGSGNSGGAQICAGSGGYSYKYYSTQPGSISFTIGAAGTGTPIGAAGGCFVKEYS